MPIAKFIPCAPLYRGALEISVLFYFIQLFGSWQLERKEGIGMAKKKALSLVYQWELANKDWMICHVRVSDVTVRVLARKGDKEIFLVSYADIAD